MVDSRRTPQEPRVVNDNNGGKEFEVALKRLEVVRVGLENNFVVSLPVPELQDFSHLKEFCGGLLNPGSDHPWSRPVSRLRLRDRLSIAGSLFLFRKILPSSPPSMDAFFEKMVQPTPEPPAGYLRFAFEQINDMFPTGWDRGWARKVETATVGVSSCLESGRRFGGARGQLMPGMGWFDRKEFCAVLMDRYSRFVPNVERVKVALAPCDGKTRIVTVNSVDMACLVPYHKLVYDWISRMEWCLRGEAKASRFSDFVSVPGEVMVSGDYESATDNLNQETGRHFMNVINRRCRFVPLHVRDAALRTFSPKMYAVGKAEVEVKRGQLMGNSMSFPLLCLQNYLAFKFIIKRRVPVKINGDDIVFRARPEEVAEWFAGVQSLGLTLSLGKTLTDQRAFSLNSTFFVAGRKKVRMAPVVRSTAVFKPLDDLNTLSGRLNTLRCIRSDRRSYWVRWLLKSVGPAIWWSQRSLRRGLEVFVSDSDLKAVNLWDREIFYLSLPSKLDPYSRTVSEGYLNEAVPEGWKRVEGKPRKDEEALFAEALIDSAWNPSRADRLTSGPESLRGPASADFKGRYSTKRYRLSSFRNKKGFKKWIRSQDRMPPFISKKQKKWVRVDDSGEQCILFTRCGFLA